jgi:hypothetical protein
MLPPGTDASLRSEADTLGRYLIGCFPTDEERLRYATAIAKTGLPMNAREELLWNRMMDHPAIIPSVDAALALKDPLNPLRHRIFVMLAILEAGPTRNEYYLPRSRADWPMALVLPAVRSVFYAAAGLILLTWFELRWRNVATLS